MVDAYQAGSIKTDDNTGWVFGSQTTTVSTRAKLISANGGGDLIVTAGKTLVIGVVIHAAGAAAVYPILMYDDDGAGTNETTVLVCPAGSQTPILTPCYIEIPAGKYVTVKSSGVGQRVYIMINGFERTA